MSPTPGLNRPDRLPRPLTDLVGREDDIASALALLSRDDVQLVTLTGPGGVGKTRFALALAERSQPDFPDGVAFVSLATVIEPDRVAETIAHAFRLQPIGERPLVDTLVEFVSNRTILLVLDNFEQVLEAAPLVSDLLAAAPSAKALVTSRARLRLRGEHEIGVAPLALPDPTTPLSAARAMEYASTALFIARTLDSQPDFRLTDDDAAALALICNRLDGLPLAIELAATRVKFLPPRAMLARLDHRLPLLTGGARDLPARQATMRDTIAWSYNLLTADQQRLMRWLSVFAGGWTLEAAEAVTRRSATVEAASEVFDWLAALVDHQLVRLVEQPDGTPRFRMLETIREFAQERLETSADAEAARLAHAAYFVELAEAEWLRQEGPELRASCDRLEREHDNLRAALGWTLERPHIELGLRLGRALVQFWDHPRRAREGWDWIERLLEAGRDAPPDLLLELRYYAAHFTRGRDQRRAVELSETLIRESRATGNSFGVARGLLMLGTMTGYLQRDYPTAVAQTEEALALFREAGRPPWIARSLAYLGTWLVELDEFERATPVLEEGLSIFRTLEHEWVAAVIDSLGHLALRSGKYALALVRYQEFFSVSMAIRSLTDANRTIVRVAEVLFAWGRMEQVVRFLAASTAETERRGSMLLAHNLIGYNQAIDAARASLSEDQFTKAWEAGYALTMEEAVAEILAIVPPSEADRTAAPAPDTRWGLSPRELEVLRLVAEGLTDAEVAERLFMARRTVNTHLTSIYTKLNVNSRAAATRFAVEHGLT